MGKKAATEMTFDKIIILILVILVILAVLLLLFKADIIEKIKNLPGFEQNPDDTVSLTADQIRLLNYAPIGSIDTIEKSYKYGKKQYITVYRLNSDYTNIGSISTRIILDSSSGTSRANGDIAIARSWDSSIVIGEMVDDRLTLTVSQTDYLQYKEDYDGLPDYSDLIKLNNAKYIGGNLFITKEKVAALPSA